MTGRNSWKAREIEILQLLAEGLTNSEIGARLHLARETVRWYNKHIFEKLGVRNRAQAVKRASELGIIGGAPTPASQTTPFPPARSPVRYAANGDVHIAYQVIGAGPVDLLFIHGFLSHLELAWENPEFTRFFEQLGGIARVILFDKRGVGLSDRIQGAPTLENTIDDARCVLDAVGSHRTFIMGTSEGGAAAVLLASTYPERVHGLILYGATPKVIRTHDEPAWADPEDRFERMIEQMQKTWGGPWAIDGFAPSRAHDERFRAWWATILRAASSPSSVKAVLDLVRQVDIRQLLPQVRVKTLVIHKTGDRLVSVEAGRYFAVHMPNATWVELPGDDHIYFVESASLLSAVAQFCREMALDSPADTRLAIILCAMTNEAGRPAGDSQSHIGPYRPTHILPTRRGVMAVFDNPSHAIQCAAHLRDSTEVFKISLHVGECSVATGTPTDPVFEIADRAAELASPGEIVVTRTLCDILAGSGYVFQPRPSQPTRRLPETIPLFALA